jgi:hypothetical protein
MRFEIELDDDLLAQAAQRIPLALPSNSDWAVAVWTQIGAQLPTTLPVAMPAELARWLVEQPESWAESLDVADIRREERAALRHLYAAARRHLPPKE